MAKEKRGGDEAGKKRAALVTRSEKEAPYCYVQDLLWVACGGGSKMILAMCRFWVSLRNTFKTMLNGVQHDAVLCTRGKGEFGSRIVPARRRFGVDVQ